MKLGLIKLYNRIGYVLPKEYQNIFVPFPELGFYRFYLAKIPIFYFRLTATTY